MAAKCFFAAVLLAMAFGASECLELNSHWKTMGDTTVKILGSNMKFPCNSTRDIYLDGGKYIDANIQPTRMQTYIYDGIITMPRLKAGVPITLGKINLRHTHPIVQPFPSWNMQYEGKCDAIQSAVDIYLDRQFILWVLDDGMTDSLCQNVRQCSAKVVCISMLTKKIIATIDLSSYVTAQSRLQYIVAETSENGDDFIYISDSDGALIMINARCQKGVKLHLPMEVTQICPKTSVLYMTITTKMDGKNYLYFTYLNCPNIYEVETSNLREQANHDYRRSTFDIAHVVGRKPKGSGIIFLGTDNFSNLFFRPIDKNDIYVWDSNTPWTKCNLHLVQTRCDKRQVTQVTPGPWKLNWIMEGNVHDFAANKLGCFASSTFVAPLIQTAPTPVTPLISSPLGSLGNSLSPFRHHLARTSCSLP